MRRVVKKVAIIAIAMVVVSIDAKSQVHQGDMSVGAGVAILSSEGESITGVFGKFRYNVTDPIRLEAAAALFSKSMVNWIDSSVSAHYLFPLNNDFTLYPLGGLNRITIGASGYSASATGFHIGGGADFRLTHRLSLNGELKLLFLEGTNFTVFGLGLMYNF